MRARVIRRKSLWSLLLVCLFVSGHAGAQQEADSAGTVRLPLDVYQNLYGKANKPEKEEGPPPVQVTLSNAGVSVTVVDEPGQPAQIVTDLTVHVLTGEWVAVRLLPAGTSLSSATLDGKAIALAVLGGDLVWSAKAKGTHRLHLVYTAPVLESALGKAVHIPVPGASAINLEATIPGDGLSVTAVPANGVTVDDADGSTSLRATVPRTTGILLSWQVPGNVKVLITSADYAGTLQDKVVAWHAEVGVKLMTNEPVSLPLVANSVALAGAKVDGKEAVVEEHGDKIAVQVTGKGRHRIQLDFETPVIREGGPTSSGLWMPRPPVSSFRLTLPGKKEVSVSPEAGVDNRKQGDKTVAVIHLPPTDRAVFSWSESIPEVAKEKLRANAEVYHLVRAEEGVLQVQAWVAYQVTRGSTNTVSAELPSTVVVNQVLGAGVTDWRVTKTPKGQTLNVYLDRDLKGDYRYQVLYELLIGSKLPEDAPVEIPVLVPGEVHRQRGMLALISGSELSMKPAESGGMTKVGENQLPVWVREGVSQTVAHTYKYVDPEAALSVKLAPPERKQGKFDAVVDTLFSVGDGVMKASASVKISIKSGKMMDLDLTLPKDINLINVTAPSLRDHKVVGEENEAQSLQLMFTQELEGTLRIEIAYERVLGGDQEKVVVPVIHVIGADTEQGRLAVEALTAVEVKTAADCEAIKAKRVLPLDVQELPRQLTLRTTNPILLAYKYVHTEPPFQLVLEVKHHEEMKVQVASIDEAVYQTLFTKDGLALTRVIYTVRNRRKQFLKVALPEESTLWSAQLAGQPVKPASGEKKFEILVPLLKSATPYQVEFVYKTTIPALGFAGWIGGDLPVPDIVETHSLWEVFLPESLTYGRVDTNMTVLEEGAVRAMQAGEDARDAQGFQKVMDAESTSGVAMEGTGGALPLRIHVPQRGVHYRFEKLYANRGKEQTRFSIHYTTTNATASGALAMVLAVLLLAWLAAGRAGLVRRPSQGLSAFLGILGIGVIVGSVLYLGANLAWAAVAAAVSALVIFVLSFLHQKSKAGAAGEAV
jgi:hypothetical protein